MKEISLTQGKVALVDDEDYAKVSKYKWFSHKNSSTVDVWYAHTNITIGKKKQTTLLMHRLVLDAEPDVHVDHADRNGLNNTRGNLRKATRAENMRNRARNRTRKTSQYKGVVLRPACVRFSAHISIDGKRTLLGRFETEEAAARAYDKAARKYYGEFARINFPDDQILQKAA